jgi:hypothetical protein
MAMSHARAFAQTKNYENPHITSLELHPISERALGEFKDRVQVMFGEFEKPSGELSFYGNVFDIYVYAPRFEFEYKDNNMDQWELHKQGLMNAPAKSTHKEVFVYPAAWKETQDNIFQAPNNDTDTDNDNDIYLLQ